MSDDASFWREGELLNSESQKEGPRFVKMLVEKQGIKILGEFPCVDDG